MPLAGRRSALVSLMRRDNSLPSSDPYLDRGQTNPGIKVADMWAAIYPMSGSEQAKDDSRQVRTRCTIEVGWYEGKDADATMYIVYGARLFDIVAILRDDVTRRNVRFVCDEKYSGV